ncbi:MAG: hypothetical protein L6Q71_09680, partial [Planctomycetes bacterium]|nr:hypothetical protein [Planctomycetota bacterium]
MPGSPIKDAYSFLRRFDARKRRLDEAMDELRKRDTPGIAIGLLDSAVRHAPLLDLLISHASTVKTNKMERAVLAAMRLGIASYLRGAPAYAAVNEAVELLPANHRARGLVNAVTRRVSEIVSIRPITDDELAGLKRADETAIAELLTPLRMPFGESAIIQGRFALFPPDLKGRLALLAGLPGWLYARLESSLEPDEIAKLCIACAMPPALWLRIVKGRESQAVKALESIPHHRDDNAIRIQRAD